MKDKSRYRDYYQSIESVAEGRGYQNSQELLKYVERDVIVGIRTKERQSIFFQGVLTKPYFTLCERDQEGNLCNPITIDPRNMTGLLVKIKPKKLSLPCAPGLEVSVKI